MGKGQKYIFNLSANVLEVHYKTKHFHIYKEIVSRPGTKLKGVAVAVAGL